LGVTSAIPSLARLNSNSSSFFADADPFRLFPLLDQIDNNNNNNHYSNHCGLVMSSADESHLPNFPVLLESEAPEPSALAAAAPIKMELMDEEDRALLSPSSSTSTSSSLEYHELRLDSSTSPTSADASTMLFGSAASQSFQTNPLHKSQPTTSISSTSSSTSYILPHQTVQPSHHHHHHCLSSHPPPPQLQQHAPQPKATPAQRGSQPPQPRQQPEKNHRGRSRTARSLWQFMLDLLQDRKTNPSIVAWVNKESMEFRVNDSNHLGHLWGVEKENPTMNFDKLSRAIRFYYKKNVFQPVANKRLIYKFGDQVRDSIMNELRKSNSSQVSAHGVMRSC